MKCHSRTTSQSRLVATAGNVDGDVEVSQVPEGSVRAHALLFDPGGTSRVRPVQPARMAFRYPNGVGSRETPISRLDLHLGEHLKTGHTSTSQNRP
jgi:hypothetical protein